MAEEVYTPEQLKKKIKGYGEKVTASIITMVAGVAIALSNLVMLPPSPEAPNLGKEYINAKETISKLKIEYNSISQFFPYKNEEIQIILNRDTTQISKLEKSVKMVEEDIFKMEENPEYIDYVNKKNKRDNKPTYGFLIGAALYLLGSIGSIIFSNKKKMLEWKQMLE